MSQQLSSLEPFPSRAASLSATAHLLHPAASLEAALSGLRPGFHALGLLLGLHHWEPSRKGGREEPLGAQPEGREETRRPRRLQGSPLHLRVCKSPSWGWRLHGHRPGWAGPVAPLPGQLLLFKRFFF